MTTIPIEPMLFIFLIITAVVIAYVRDLFAAAMLFGVFSLLSAGLFTLLDAVDVAFTEAAVGAGISTVLFLGALALTNHQEYQRNTRGLPFVVVLVMGLALFYGTLDMPHFGDPKAPIHTHLADEIIRLETEAHANAHAAPEDKVTKGPDELQGVGLPNIVTSVLGSYRGYDTFGETIVVFTAGIGVFLILGRRRDEEDEANDADNADADADDTDEAQDDTDNNGVIVDKAPSTSADQNAATHANANPDDDAGGDANNDDAHKTPDDAVPSDNDAIADSESDSDSDDTHEDAS